ncbi:MAG: hypothetical protein RLN96_13070, partial [Pseudomonadales bacterium]
STTWRAGVCPGSVSLSVSSLIGWTAYEGRYGEQTDVGDSPIRVLLAREKTQLIGWVLFFFLPQVTLR